MTPISILERARSLILQGWNQGSFNRIQPDGRSAFCLKGAIYQASNDLRRENAESITLMSLQTDEALGAIRNVIGKGYLDALGQPDRFSTDGTVDSIVAFNDHSGRTQTEVVAVIDLVLKEAA